MRSRIEKQTDWESALGENIMYGGDTPIEAVLSLAIDDGVAVAFGASGPIALCAAEHAASAYHIQRGSDGEAVETRFRL